MMDDTLRFQFRNVDGVILMVIPLFLQYGFEKHGFTTRLGGVSPAEFRSLNLSKTRENNERNKTENFKRASGAAGVVYGSLVLANYTHGDGIYFAQPDDAGKGFTREIDYPACDAVVVDDARVTAVTLHADCVPVFFADKNKRAVCVAHAGWKGTYARLPQKVVCGFQQRYGSDTADILVGIGPHMMACHFEVQQDVAGLFSDGFGACTVQQREGRLYVDMQQAILMQLADAGIPESNIACANICTYCRNDLFYSHRRDQGRTGAMGSFITV